MGKHLEGLGGQYIAAEDSGTSVADLKIMGRHTKHVAGIVERIAFDGQPSNGDPSPTTAYGTFVGLKAAIKYKLGREDLTGLKVAIQGVGNVGYRLARHLKEAGAELWVYDIYHANMQRAIDELGAHAASAEDILFLPVDVVAPCAMGAVLNDDSIPRLKATIIAGAANNLLQRPDHDRALKDRGILYAPDFAINAGGIIDVFYERTGASPEKVRTHVEGIGRTLTEIFTRSDASGMPTGAVANTLAEERFQKHSNVAQAPREQLVGAG
jgi:leucine dehydrogenase